MIANETITHETKMTHTLTTIGTVWPSIMSKACFKIMYKNVVWP